jgi:hypothetical protein
MQTKFVAATLILVIIVGFSAFVVADLSVGVKEGDWIEYSVTSTGAPIDGHDVTWARMQVTGVQGANISVTITSRFSDNTSDTINGTLNLQTGHLIDDFIIPANLNVGDTFIDENLGNITIDSKQTRLYAGATRTVLISTVGNNTYVWDKTTGVSLEGKTQTDTYTIHSIVKDTNMWQPQPTPSTNYDFTSLILVVAFCVIVLAVILMATARYIKRKANQMRVGKTSI